MGNVFSTEKDKCPYCSGEIARRDGGIILCHSCGRVLINQDSLSFADIFKKTRAAIQSLINQNYKLLNNLEQQSCLRTLNEDEQIVLDALRKYHSMKIDVENSLKNNSKCYQARDLYQYICAADNVQKVLVSYM